MLSDIPAALKQLPHWVGWRHVTKDGKRTKVPFDLNRPGQWAKADDKSTWTTFEKAKAATDPLEDGGYDGLGFELGGTTLVGVDFDGAITKKGIIDPYVLEILRLLKNPYTETSPSGGGLHAFVECDALPAGQRKMSQGHIGIEIYHGQEGGRYLTVTGNRVAGENVPRIADISLPYLLITQNKDKKFRRLWLGDASDYEGDESQADFHLMWRLAGLTNNNAVKMEEYFSESGLGQREKWTDRKDYRDRTIKAAIETNKTGKLVLPTLVEFHSDPAYEKGREPEGDYVIGPAEGQQDGWFPLGDISLIGGASGTGKTTLLFEMLYAQKQGWEFLGHKSKGRPFHVLAYDRGENAFKRTLNRLGRSREDIPTTELPLAFGLEAVQNIVNQIETMDPRPAVVYIEGMDMLLDDTNKKSVVAPFMREMQNVAAHFHIALVGSLGAPKAKKGEDYAAKRDHLSGSEAWGRNCETVAVIEFAEDDDGTNSRRLLTVLPRNAKAEKFIMEFDEHGRLVPVEAAALEAEKPKQGGRPNEQMQAAVDFTQKVLQSGPRPGKWLIEQAKVSEGIQPGVMYRMKRDKILLIETVEINGDLNWRLPPLHAGLSEPVEESQVTTQLNFHDRGPMSAPKPVN